MLVRADRVAAYGFDVIEGQTKTDRLSDGRRSGLKAGWRRRVGHTVLAHLVNHLATAHIGGIGSFSALPQSAPMPDGP